MKYSDIDGKWRAATATAEQELRGRPDFSGLRRILAAAEGKTPRGEPQWTSTQCGDFEAKIMGNYIALSPAYLAVLLDFVPLIAQQLNDQQRGKP